jgi:hypothetical protein
VAKINTIQSSFLLGEVSPRLRGRTNDDQYIQMAEELTNVVVIPQGGVQGRPGTQLQEYDTVDFDYSDDGVIEVACDDFKLRTSNKFREYPFITSDGKKWILIIRNDSMNKWNIFDVDEGKLYPVPSGTQIGVMNNSVLSITQGSAYYDIDATTIQDLDEIQIEKSGDVLFITHTSFYPLTIRYIKLTSILGLSTEHIKFPTAERFDFAFRPMGAGFGDTFDSQKEFLQAHPYLEKNISNNQGQGYISYSAVAHNANTSVTLTSSTGIFDSSWVGTQIRFTNLATPASGTVVISSVTNSTTATGYVLYVLPTGGIQYGVAADTYWEESAWSYKNGFPSAVCAYGGRILYGGTPTRPNRVWASAVGDVDELCEIPYAQDPIFSTYLDDGSRAYSFDIVGCEFIRWMSSGKKVFVGASNREFIIQGADNSITPDDTTVIGATSYGSAYRPAVRIGSEILFTPRSKQRTRSLVFSFQEDEYKSQDISKLAEHLCRKSKDERPQEIALVPSFGAMSVTNSPDTRIWCTDNNGGLHSCTYDRDASTIAWSSHKLGGSIGGGYGDSPYVFSAGVLPSYDSSRDEVYVMAMREMNGANIVTLEKIGGYFEEEEYTNSTFSPLNAFPDYLRTRAVFVDCATGSVPLSPTDTFTFESHKNEEVSVLADGIYLGEYTLDGSGVLTLDEEYSEVIIGYKYDMSVKTMDLEVPGSGMSNQTKPKTAPEVWCRFNRTSHAKARRAGQEDWQTFEFVGDANQSDSPVELFTGDKRVQIGNVDRNLSIEILQDKPLPFELMAIVFNGMIYD